MKIKMLKDQSWSIKKKIQSFKKDEIKEIDEKIALDMIRLDYGIKIVEDTSIDNKMVCKCEDNKSIEAEPTICTNEANDIIEDVEVTEIPKNTVKQKRGRPRKE